MKINRQQLRKLIAESVLLVERVPTGELDKWGKVRTQFREHFLPSDVLKDYNEKFEAWSDAHELLLKEMKEKALQLDKEHNFNDKFGFQYFLNKSGWEKNVEKAKALDNELANSLFRFKK